LPWNGASFTSFEELVATLISEKEEMMERFLEKLNSFFNFPIEETFKFRHDIKRLLELDVAKEIAAFKNSNELTADELAELDKLATLYLWFQEDVRRFWELGTRLTTDPSFIIDTQSIDFPISYGFYLLIKAIGAGEFCDKVANLKQ
jgi:hypothetical protein